MGLSQGKCNTETPSDGLLKASNPRLSLVSEDDTQRQTRATQADDDAVAAQTHTTGCSCHVDAVRQEKRRKRDRQEGVAVFGRIVEAHESVKEDWKEYHDRRPDDVREAVWFDPLYTPTNPTEKEQKFIKTRRIRRRNLRFERGGQT